MRLWVVGVVYATGTPLVVDPDRIVIDAADEDGRVRRVVSCSVERSDGSVGRYTTVTAAVYRQLGPGAPA